VDNSAAILACGADAVKTAPSPEHRPQQAIDKASPLWQNAGLLRLAPAVSHRGRGLTAAAIIGSPGCGRAADTAGFGGTILQR
jgi:hypothetical protein